ncbi:hypothetical protein BpHYR1_016862 [Brachionus plicatilis]|uniref:Fibronectin type-III domain-containing protein n=1 Tax=Brachionus plicatilis TaxID=10195 RepID=A0A3M7SU11_BRAPC|nr:hypothetical protein BpHYR1_016862 [Brachionus plicatilis]
MLKSWSKVRGKMNKIDDWLDIVTIADFKIFTKFEKINNSHNPKAYCGKTLKHPTDEKQVCCIVGSQPSNKLSVTPTAPPDAVQLRLASISTDGVELSWSFPQQYGDAVLSGFQLVKNGRCHGHIIPSDQSSFKVTDIELGETAEFQMISLTNHPVGKYTSIEKHPDYSMDQPQRQELFNPTVNASAVHSDYPACKISSILSVKYTNLVKPVVKIWTEKVTGFSAIVAFQTSKMNENFVEPDYYLVSYWPGTNPSDRNTKTLKTENFCKFYFSTKTFKKKKLTKIGSILQNNFRPFLWPLFWVLNKITELRKSFSELLGITFDENLYFDSYVDFIRSSCIDRVNILKFLAQKSWKLNFNTLVNINKKLIGSIIDYSFFIPILDSKTNLSRLQVLQNISIKCSYNFPQDTSSDLLKLFLIFFYQKYSLNLRAKIFPLCHLIGLCSSKQFEANPTVYYSSRIT